MAALAGAIDPRAARALAAFGAAGIAIVLTLAVLTILVLGPLVVDGLALAGDGGQVPATLDSAAATLDSMAGAASDAGSSLAESEAAVRDAADVTRQLADAASGLAAFSSAFADTASRSRALSDDLNRTADALAQNQSDSLSVGDQLRGLAEQVRQLRASLGSAPGTDGPTAMLAALGPILLVTAVLALLGWVAVASAAALWLGRRALRIGAPARARGRGPTPG